MSWPKWTLIAACLLTACSSGSSSGKGGSTTTTTSKAGTIAATAWKDVAQGTFDKTKWTVASARSSAGWRCYDTQGVAAAAGTTTTTVGGGPTRDGRTVHCLAPASTSATAPFAAFVNGADGKDWVLVGAAADGVKKVSIVFANGTSSPLNIDPKSRLVIWKGPASVKPKQVRTDNTTCTIATNAGATDLCDGVTAAA
jgi:hypothetical protein